MAQPIAEGIADHRDQDRRGCSEDEYSGQQRAQGINNVAGNPLPYVAATHRPVRS
jgi:hypothetical protein